jgi:O-antigen/teichoic acid export membrane protein
VSLYRAQLQALRRLVQLTPFDTRAEGGRASERHRRIVLSAIAAAAARAVTVLSGLVTVPLAVRYLGPERYGLFIAIASLVALLSWADFGIGNGVLTRVADAHGRDDRDAVRTAVSSAFFVLVGIAVLLGAVFALIAPAVPWGDLFNVASGLAESEAGPAVAVFVGCTLVAMPLGVAQRAQLAFQEGFLASLWIGAGSVLGLIGLVLAIELDAGLPWLVAATAGGPAVALLLNAAWLFGRQRPWLRPSVHAWDGDVAHRIVQTGFLFLILQVAMAVAYESDALIVARVLGVEEVTVFAVTFKLFAIAPILLSFVLTPLWPAYTEAMATGDEAWAKRTLLRSLRLSVAISVPFALVLVVFGESLVHAWVGSNVTPSLLLRIALAAWTVLMSVSGAVAMFLNGIGAMRFQALCAASMMIANVAISIVLTRTIGVSGVVWGSAIAQIAFVLVPAGFYVLRSFRTNRIGPG